VAHISDVARASLYRAPINLWVEDEVTRTYLSEIWNNPAVAFLIGGGDGGLQAIVSDAEKAGYPNVFAVVDRDFRRSNKPNWAAPSKTSRRFILPVHEIENYLLDRDGLTACRFNNLGRTKPEIENIMKSAAGRLCWWAACRDVVAELKRRFRQGFVSDPKCDVSNESQAREHICRSPWFQNLAQETADTTEANIHQLLTNSHVSANQSLADGRWKTEFAGKEILHDVGSRICDRTRFTNYRPSAAEFDQDVAKEIGACQRENNAVPPDLVDLLQALQLRIARP